MPGDRFDLNEVLAKEAAAIRPEGDPKQPFSALCISGGGIRSATFALGAIQSLAEHGLLTQFDYLSTVSGGGYIGSWLSAWAAREKGLENVVPHLRWNGAKPGEHKPDPIQHLREYNNYLTPKVGGFSADTWTLVATVLRNLSLNWLLLIPLLLGLLMAPRLLFSVAYVSQKYAITHPMTPRVIADSPAVTIAIPLVMLFLFFFGMLHIWRYLPGVGGVNHTSSDFMKRVLWPLIGATLLFCSYDALHYWDDSAGILSLQTCLIATLIPAGLSWVVFLAIGGRSGKMQRKLFFSLTAAVLLLGVSLAYAEWLITKHFAQSPDLTWSQYVTFVPPLIGFGFFAALTIFAGLSSGHLEDKDREWLSRASGALLLTCVGWLAACCLVLVAPQWVFTARTWGPGFVVTAGSISGWLSRMNRRDGKAPAGQPGWMATVVKLAPAVFLLCLAVALAILTNLILHYTAVPGTGWWNHGKLLEDSAWYALVALTAAFFAVGSVAARFVNINKFSLFGMYRDRLIRAYLGASNPMRVGRSESTTEAPNLFTGFAESDNLNMSELLRRPFHVVNLTLNLVGGERLAWQQRKAESFSVTPLHCGNYHLGYRPSDRYCRGISLGTAVAISGAAASPNMGYHSSPAIGFIMTLLNARLGAWLGNPGPAGDKTWRLAGPRSAVGSLLKEALGLTTDKSEYVYLSDGGHFENLGLYEMILRRVRHIVVLDSGCDEFFTYEDLGNALRKIRIDLRVGVEFQMIDEKRRCAVARIDYGEGEPGWVVYIKPRVLKDEPPDVSSYARQNPCFPHQSTGDQWFDESQTESYRMLGMWSVDCICRDWPKTAPLADFEKHIMGVYLRREQQAAVTT